MSATASPRPDKSEYPTYAESYVARVPDGDIVAILGRQLADTLALIRGIPEARGDFRYAEGKWSVKEVFGHVIDTERVFAYRALRFARGDATPLAGFEQDDYVRNAGFAARRLADLAEEFSHVRRASVALFRGLDEPAWLRRGIANEKEVSVRALAYIIAGHERHHLNVLQSKYLPLLA